MVQPQYWFVGCGKRRADIPCDVMLSQQKKAEQTLRQTLIQRPAVGRPPEIINVLVQGRIFKNVARQKYEKILEDELKWLAMTASLGANELDRRLQFFVKRLEEDT